jgi:hypothetical protein
MVTKEQALTQIQQAHPDWGPWVIDMYYTRVLMMDTELGVCSFGEDYKPEETYQQYKMWTQLNG